MVTVNDVCGGLIDEEAGRSGTCNVTKSSQWTEGPGDMLQFTLRVSQKLYTTFDQYAWFPFDRL